MAGFGLKPLTRFLTTFCCVLMFTTTALQGANFFNPSGSQTIALEASSSIVALSNKPVSAMDQTAREMVDEVVGAGTSDRIQGQVDEAIGAATQQVSTTPSQQVKGSLKQVQGQVEQSIGRTKQTAEDLGSQVQAASEEFVKSVQDAFDR